MNGSALSFSAVRTAPPTGGGGLEKLQLIAERSKNGKQLSESEIQEVGRQFESLLLHQLLTTMRRSIPDSGLFGDSSAKDIYEDLFDQHIAETVSQGGQTGIAETIVEELRRQQSQVVPSETASVFRPLGRETFDYKAIQQKENLIKRVDKHV